ncbi:MAG TPA: ABC transporter permease [Longimicrobiales bacterium]|nr:ABC transporter permease [Longimicrobiales bacterium]
MSWYKRVVNLLRPERLSRELDREIAFHVAERADELMAAGMSEAEALREARRRFGNVVLQKERTREVDVVRWLESVLADVRYALRALRASPGFALVAVLSLGLGIGANTAVFSLIDAVLLRSLPVERPEELVKLTMGEPGNDVFTNPQWEQVRDRQDVFSGVFAFSGESWDLATGGAARRIRGEWVSGGFFPTLGVRPALGRLLGPRDDVRGCPAVAVLGHGFWEREYGGDPGAVGRTVSLDGHPFEVVGVAEPAFFGVEVGRAVDVYAPLCAEAIVRGKDSFLDRRSTWFLQLIGRPRPGASLAQARTRLAAMAPAVFSATVPADWKPGTQREYLKRTLSAEPAGQGVSPLRPRYRHALAVLMVVVGLVLLNACANVANLLLARATARRRELAVRLAIGAGRGRLARQLLTESLLLSLLGAAVGVAFARWGSALLVRLLSTRADAVWLDLSIDGRVLGFTIAVATLTGLLFGLAPAWRSARVDPQAAMRASARSVAEGHSRLTLVKALVAGQVALSLVLVVGAALLLGSFRNLATLDPGFRRTGILLVGVDLKEPGIADARALALLRGVLDRVRALPGVRAASASRVTPVGPARWNDIIHVDGYTPSSTNDALVWMNSATPGFFATMGTRLLAGRDFTDHDAPGAPRVAIINRALATKFFGASSPLGRRFRTDSNEAWLEVVGVVEDAKYVTLREQPSPTAYVPLSQEDHQGAWFSLELRTDGPPAALARSVENAVAEVVPAASLDFTTMSDQLAASIRPERLLAVLSGFFGALGLLLAVIGLYGTTAYSVTRRRSEIGIRIALGAMRTRVVRMVMREVGVMVAAGMILGALLALAATRLVASFLFGVAPGDPATFALAALVLGLVAGAAGALPAWRAARLDPMAALREE